MKLNYKDFNEMSDKELRKLPGVGRTTVARIVGFRPFRNNNDLFKVKGLGAKTLKKLGIVKLKKKKKVKQLTPEVSERAAVLANLKKQIATAKVNAQRAATIKAQEKVEEASK